VRLLLPRQREGLKMCLEGDLTVIAILAFFAFVFWLVAKHGG
jgi:hypothetical protein